MLFTSPEKILVMYEKASTARLLIVDSEDTIFRLAQIQVSATGAFKFNRR